MTEPSQNGRVPSIGGRGSGDLGQALMVPIRNLRDYLMIIRERWLLALTAALVVSALFLFLTFRQTPIYAATATMLIELQSEKVLEIEKVVDTSLEQGNYEARLDGHLVKLRSRSFREHVVGRFSQEEKERIVAPYRETSDRSPSVIYIVSSGCAIDRDGQVFDVSITHRDPEVAAMVANRYTATYIESVLDSTGTSNALAQGFLQARAKELKRNVEEGERALQNYRQKQNLVSLEAGQNIIVDRLNHLNLSLTQARIERLGVGAKVTQVESVRDQDEGLLSIPTIADFGSIPSILDEVKDATNERAELDRKYLERHPRILASNVRLKALQERLDEHVERAVEHLHNRQAELINREERLVEEVALAGEDALRLDRMAIDYNVLRRQLEGDLATYDLVLTRSNETSVASKLQDTNFQILDGAEPWGVPIKPNRLRAFILAVFIFVGVLIGVPISLELLDNKLKSHWDVDQFLNKELLTDIHQLSKTEKAEFSGRVLDRPEDRALESFRALYSRIIMLSEVEGPKVILVSSSMPAEGKTFVVANLGATFARHGKRTLLADTDLRRPRLHTVFDLKNDQGIIQWLESGGSRHAKEGNKLIADPDLGITEVAEMLFVLGPGGYSKRPTEMMGDFRFERLLSSLKQEFDIILLDSPPAGVFADAYFLGELADETLFVCRHNAVNRQKVRYFIDRLDQTNAPVLGVVLNGVRGSGVRAYGYGYYGYGYDGYGYDRNKEYHKYYAEQPNAIDGSKAIEKTARMYGISEDRSRRQSKRNA